MPVKKLLYLLSREEITEIALQCGRPPCALVNGEYRRIRSEPLVEEEIIAILAAAGGRENLAGLADGRSWDFQAGIGTVRISAAYDNSVLKAAMRRAGSAPARAATAAEAPQVTAPKTTSVLRAPELAPPAAAAPPPPSAVAAPQPPAPAAAPQPPPPSAAAREPGRSADGSDRSFGEAADAPTVQTVSTLHNAFNFEPATGWSRPPPASAGDAGAQPAPTPKRAKAKFVGDLLDDLLGEARTQRASDVHVVAGRPAMFRLAGELVQRGEPISEEQAEKLLLARVPPNLRDVLRRDGSCDFSLVHPAYGRFRTNVSNQRTGWKLTARPIGEHVPTLAELGLPASIANALEHHQGLIVVTGPTGHGKTTTLAAIVGIINRDTSHHVITVEDPIEYVHPPARAVISQREVVTHTKTFQAALKGSLREDPDVIVVGELRDTETVRMALTASETGHLVISTMNTPSAAKAIERLIDLFPPADQAQVRMTLAGGLRMIISQRLVPSIDGTRLHAAAEVLPGVLQLWNLIRDNRTYQIASLQQRGKALGIVRLDDSLAELVRAGKISLETAKQVAETPEHIEPLAAGRAITIQGSDIEERRAAAAAAAAKKAANPNSAAATTSANAAAAAKKGKELGKQVMSRAGKLFGNDSK